METSVIERVTKESQLGVESSSKMTTGKSILEDPLSPTKRPRDEEYQMELADVPTELDQHQEDHHQDKKPHTLGHSDQPPVQEELTLRPGYRVGAGGSLRMPKKRAPRTRAMDIQWEQEPEGPPPPSSNFDFEAPPSTSVSGEMFSVLGIDEDGSSSATTEKSVEFILSPPKSKLNPRAETFVSPQRSPAVGLVNPSHQALPFKGGAFEKQSPATSHLSIGSSKTLDFEEGGCRRQQKGDPIKNKTKSDNIAPPRTEAAAGLDKGKAPIGPTRKKGKKPAKPANKEAKPGLNSEDWPSLPLGKPRERSSTVDGPPAAWAAKRGAASHPISPRKGKGPEARPKDEREVCAS